MDTPTILQGTTSALRVNLALEDLTGWTFRAQIRSRQGQLLAEWKDEQIERHPFVLFLPLDPDVTDDWTWSNGELGLEATSPAGQILRAHQGSIVLSREVVRDDPPAPVTSPTSPTGTTSGSPQW